jgi:hypothetical protein
LIELNQGMARKIFGVLILGTLAVSCGGGGGSTPTTPPACVEFTAAQDPAGGRVAAQANASSSCELLLLDVMVTDLDDVFAADFDVTFNQALIRYDGYSLTGSLLTSGTAMVEDLEDRGTGITTLSLSRVAPAGGVNVTTSTRLVQLRFRRNADSGTATVSFPRGVIFGSEEPPEEKTGLTWYGGTATIR